MPASIAPLRLRRASLGAATVLVLATLGGCGGAEAVHPRGTALAAGGASERSASSTASQSGSGGGYAFPVRGRASYDRTHHDYPATDVMAACGLPAVAAADGVVLEVNRVDSYDARIDAGATRGGLSVSIRGDDGVRYYGSHFSSIDPAVVPGSRVSAGQQIAVVGRTGDASACHVHFGISPLCAGTGDWWVRRGVIWPAGYLDAWRSGWQRSAAAEAAAWQARNGCPTRPTVDP